MWQIFRIFAAENELLMITNGKYRHTYTSTASDITPLYRLTPDVSEVLNQDL